ncbi:hypothetical protein QYM36_017242 [Artemia franciscana]|uniref:Uncharacterized protein n=1 Tax=Artemia franciscana TaxID=6661 RepID=A0AA88H584_ARTSF|nr:hypothetical protein QYM36_017242 [Artemia franciscana]
MIGGDFNARIGGRLNDSEQRHLAALLMHLNCQSAPTYAVRQQTLKKILQPCTSLGRHSLSWVGEGTISFGLYKKQNQVPAASITVKQDDNTESLALDLIDVQMERVQDQNRIINE